MLYKKKDLKIGKVIKLQQPKFCTELRDKSAFYMLPSLTYLDICLHIEIFIDVLQILYKKNLPPV